MKRSNQDQIKIKSLIASIGLSLLMFACQPKDETGVEPLKDVPSGSIAPTNEIVLGEQVDNPYALHNIQQAMSNLSDNGRLAEGIEIEPTHLYVRFLPADSIELEMLWSDTTLLLYDYPLDYEFEIEGHWYHDPSLPELAITWQYTVVPYNYEFPQIEHEVLYALYMPEDLEFEVESANARKTSSNWEEIEEEAMIITGHLERETSGGRVGAIQKYRPGGKIRVEERQNRWVSGVWGGTTTGTIGLKGARVKARWLTRTGFARTNAEGEFRMSKKFRSKVNYSIEFEMEGYRVTNWLGWSRNHNKHGKTKSDWNTTLNYGAEYESWVYGTMMSAIYDYKVQAEKHGVAHNKSNNSYVKLRALMKAGRSNVIGIVRHLWADGLIGNDSRIHAKYNDGTKLQTDDFYRLIMHELGHVSHFMTSGPLIILSRDGIITESWAQATEYFFTLPYYPAKVSKIPDPDRKRIIGGNGDGWMYTPFFVDLVDNDNQLHRLGGDRPDDDVNGYTLSQIQSILRTRSTLTGIRRSLSKSKYANPTYVHFGKLKAFYQNIEDHH